MIALYVESVGFRSVRINPGEEEENVTVRKPFIAIQWVQFPPGKGQPAGSESCMGGGNIIIREAYTAGAEAPRQPRYDKR
jgi:hypothetical protein